ncbi:MAG: c-type cytochrome biogenesis protein CcmI [Methylovulum sp.]|nr:c-type cytochrome biogenesis protein CcmI [Methylovulum sp.]
MLMFWLSVGALILLALAFLVPPLWRPMHMPSAARDTRNVLLAKNRLQELNAQLQAGELTHEAFEAQRSELELALVDDLEDSPELGALVAATHSRGVAVGLIIFVPLLALSLYAGLGHYQAIDATPAMIAAQQAETELTAVTHLVADLAEKMRAEPTNAEGWIMLGKSYKYLQHYADAVSAFEKAYALLGDRADILVLYADALAFANNEQLAGKPEQLVSKALALEPDNVTALWLGGMAKVQTGDVIAGDKLWRKLGGLLPKDAPEQAEIQRLLSKLESQIPASAKLAEEIEEAKATQAAPVNIEVNVSLAKALQAKVSAADTVFIYAQAMQGGRMPLAIISKKVADLPVTVSLTDAMAMLPTMKLSLFQRVKLLARVSKSGNAMPQPGDLIGTLEGVDVLAKQQHVLEITTQVAE